jgi:hypothetical protein
MKQVLIFRLLLPMGDELYAEALGHIRDSAIADSIKPMKHAWPEQT